MIDRWLWSESQGTNWARRLIEQSRRLLVQECPGPLGRARGHDPTSPCDRRATGALSRFDLRSCCVAAKVTYGTIGALHAPGSTVRAIPLASRFERTTGRFL